MFPDVDDFFDKYKQKHAGLHSLLNPGDHCASAPSISERPDTAGESRVNADQRQSDANQAAIEEETETPGRVDFHKEMQVNFDENDIDEIQHNEKLIFLVLYRRLSDADLLVLLKLFALYSNSVISYLGGCRI